MRFMLPMCLMALAACEVSVNNGSDAGTKPDASAKDSGNGSEPDSGDDADSGTLPASVNCDQRGATPTTTVTRAITEDTTWSGVVSVQGDIDVREPAVLTIKPGTLVVMDSDSRLTVGWNSGAAKISAEGTAAQPIRFCGKRAEPGYYKQINIESKVKSDSVLRHVLIADGGGAGSSAALQLDAGILVEDVVVESSGADGVAARSFKRGSSRLSVVKAAKHAVRLETAEAVHNFPAGGPFTLNQDNVIVVDFNTISADTTFANHGIPYRQQQSIDISGGEIHIAAGVEYQLTADAALVVGWNSNTCSFFVDGTAEKPVQLRGVEATSGYWAGLLFERNVRSESKLRYLKLSHAGGNNRAPLDLSASVTLDHVTLDKNAAAARLQASLGSGSAALTITGSDGVPLEVELDAAISLPPDSKFAGNHTDFVVITGDDYNSQGTLHRFDVPYRVKESIDAMDGSALTIAPGTTLVMTADTQLTIGWNSSSAKITAEGEAEKPITFRGESDVTGFWKGIVVEPNALTDSAFDYVVVANAGKAGGAALVLDANVPLSHSAIRKSAGDGIWADDAFTTDYASNNTFSEIAGSNIVKR